MIYRLFNQQACDAFLAQCFDEMNPNVEIRCDMHLWSRGISNGDRQQYEYAMSLALARFSAMGRSLSAGPTLGDSNSQPRVGEQRYGNMKRTQWRREDLPQ